MIRWAAPLGKLQACLLIFLFAVVVRLLTLNQMGKTWDEPAYVEVGYHYVELAKKGNFDDPFWYELADHPPLIRYIYGLASVFDIKTFDENGKPEFFYNYTFARFISVLLGSLSGVFLVLIGYEYFSRFVGFASGIIFSLIPFFVGLSQLATLESFMMFFFTGTVYFFIGLLKTNKSRYIVLTGVFSGLSLLVKQSNVIVYPLLVVIIAIWYLFNRKKLKDIRKLLKQLVGVGMCSITTVFLLWPMPFFHIKETWQVQESMWIHAVKLPPPEVFFGSLMLVPWPYYILMFIVTTPIVLLVLLMIGFLSIDRKRTFIGFAILLWFLFPFLQTFYAFKQHGIRYIIEVYAPFSLLCGLGLSYIASYFQRIKNIKIVLLVYIVVYLSLVLNSVSPYFLDYFNEVVGGNKNVYEKRLFQMGWWGQGIAEATYYIAGIADGNVIVAVDGEQPTIVMPRFKNMTLVDYKNNKNADFVIVPYFNVVRLWFPEGELQKKFHVVHVVRVNSVPLVKVYKRI